MAGYEKSDVDAHVAALIGEKNITMKSVRAYQDERARFVFQYAKEHSRFYRELYADIEGVRTTDDLLQLPVITGEHVRQYGARMLCVDQERIERIYTTGGSTGKPKRLYFTKQELEQTVKFYEEGIPSFIGPGDTVLILLPCGKPYSVGRLFGDSVERVGAAPVYGGMPETMDLAYRMLMESRANVAMTAPHYMLGMLKLGLPLPRLKSIVISTDYLDPGDKASLTEAFHAPVFEHYAMTEMCFGGGVECGAHAGFHMREADFFFEIIHPDGTRVAPGEYGLLVFTTLRREGMPLIRYATGDVTRMIKEPCPCKSILPLYDKMQKRENQKAYSEN
ncbi:AMP-binding protein [Christensenellaceae bacterium OttesenSCG-928-M15]|nr:AMP-binding protein [Christensenellaceae bacterium OttesenSCG-928-M15]